MSDLHNSNRVQELDSKRDLLDSMNSIRDARPLGGLAIFNIEFGYIEALLRGLRSGFLKGNEYRALCQCESFEDVKLTLGDTDYCNVLSNVSKLSPEIIERAISNKFIEEFYFLQSQAVAQLASFLDYITYDDLITNISFVITSLIRGADPSTLLAKCSPLGRNPHLRTVLTFDNIDTSDGLLELYRTVLIDMPVGKYFEQYFNLQFMNDTQGIGGDGGGGGSGYGDTNRRDISRVYNEIDIDIISNMIQRFYLEDFYLYVTELGGETAHIMSELLEYEADRRAISIMINSFNTPLNDASQRDSTRKNLFCKFGKLYPECTQIKFTNVTDFNQLQAVLEPYKIYSDILKQSLDTSLNRSLDDLLYEYEVKLCVQAFEGQSHFAAFYAYVKLKKQEERNIKWIIQCIHQRRDQKDFQKWIKIF